MGDIKRRRKRYVRPRRLHDIKRVEEENKIIESYGLKNKREIWKADTAVSEMRKRGKLLISSEEKDKLEFFNKLYRLGLNVNSVEDVLALTKEDWLNRRLQTEVFKKGLAKTLKQARQLIVHKNILVNNEIVNSPSFVVTRELEDKIKIKEKNMGAKKNE
jgi:small subunit ribosomal protein S4